MHRLAASVVLVVLIGAPCFQARCAAACLMPDTLAPPVAATAPATACHHHEQLTPTNLPALAAHHNCAEHSADVAIVSTVRASATPLLSSPLVTTIDRLFDRRLHAASPALSPPASPPGRFVVALRI